MLKFFTRREKKATMDLIIDRNESSSVKACEMCLEEFDRGKRCPRILKCLHTLCSCCIVQLIRGYSRMCPFCDEGFNAERVDDVPINKTALGFMEYLEQLERGQDDERSQVPVMRSNSCEVQDPVKLLMLQARIFSNQPYLGCGSSFTGTNDSSHYNTTDKQQSHEVSRNVRDCPLCRDDYDNRERCPRLFKCLHTVCSMCIGHMIMNKDKRCPFCRRAFKASSPEDIPVNKTAVDFIAYVNQLEAKIEEDEEDIYYINRIDNMKDEQEHITTDDLLTMSYDVRKTLSEGRLFAVHEEEGREKKIAKISYNDDQKLCLHVLTDGVLPSNACLIEYSDVLDLVDCTSNLAFLEIGVCGSALGRLYIRLHKDQKGGQQFIYLCTGEKGPSYANCNMLQVWSKGREGERVLCGDYEFNNGGGGKALISGLREDELNVYSDSLSAGSIVGCWGLGDEVGSQFYIYTRDSPNRNASSSFGIVEEGLHVLTEAVSQYSNIRYVSIQDCGLVLELLGS